MASSKVLADLIDIPVNRLDNERGYERVVRVRLFSAIKKDIGTNLHQPLRNTAEETMAKWAFVAGAALAEDQNERYLDRHDPSKCGNAAARAVKTLLKLLNNGNQKPDPVIETTG